MSNKQHLEYCGECDEPTGRAGKYEDSIYCDSCGSGPFCENCKIGENTCLYCKGKLYEEGSE